MKKVNLVMVLLLGTVVAVSSTATVKGALAMAIAAGVVMILTALFSNILKLSSPASVILFTTVCATAVALLLNAFLPSLYELSGMYISLLAVNLLTYSASNRSVKDVCVTSLQFALVLVCVGVVRELLATGSIYGVQLISGLNAMVFANEAGGLIVYAIVVACVQKIVPAQSMCIGSALGLNGNCGCHKEGE